MHEKTSISLHIECPLSGISYDRFGSISDFFAKESLIKS